MGLTGVAQGQEVAGAADAGRVARQRIGLAFAGVDEPPVQGVSMRCHVVAYPGFRGRENPGMAPFSLAGAVQSGLEDVLSRSVVSSGVKLLNPTAAPLCRFPTGDAASTGVGSRTALSSRLQEPSLWVLLLWERWWVPSLWVLLLWERWWVLLCEGYGWGSENVRDVDVKWGCC